MRAQLELVRSDHGDGGWSLEVGDRIVLAGPSDRDACGEWTRPDAEDYAEADRLIAGI